MPSRKILCLRLLYTICAGYIKEYDDWEEEQEYRISYLDIDSDKQFPEYSIIVALQRKEHEKMLNDLGLNKENLTCKSGTEGGRDYYPLKLKGFFNSFLIPYISMGSECILNLDVGNTF